MAKAKDTTIELIELMNISEASKERALEIVRSKRMYSDRQLAEILKFTAKN